MPGRGSLSTEAILQGVQNGSCLKGHVMSTLTRWTDFFDAVCSEKSLALNWDIQKECLTA